MLFRSKTRIVPGQQQVTRLDREARGALTSRETEILLGRLDRALERADAVIVGDYGKGVVTQSLLNGLKSLCRERGVWLSLDPKPVHHLDLAGLSLITPNRKEAFELAGKTDGPRSGSPLADERLLGTCLRAALDVISRGEGR